MNEWLGLLIMIGILGVTAKYTSSIREEHYKKRSELMDIPMVDVYSVAVVSEYSSQFFDLKLTEQEKEGVLKLMEKTNTTDSTLMITMELVGGSG